MLEINITITAPELANAMLRLASALECQFEEVPDEELTPLADDLPPASPIPKAETAPDPTPAPVAPVATDLAPAVPVAAAPVAAAPAAVPVAAVPIAAAPAAAVPVAAVPVAPAPTFTREQIMAAGAALIDAGKTADLMNLLLRFEVAAVSQLRQEQLGAFATELRKLGAKI